VSGHVKTLMMETDMFSKRLDDLNHLRWLSAQEENFAKFHRHESFKTHKFFCLLYLSATFTESDSVW
jgi:hypothetical protein